MSSKRPAFVVCNCSRWTENVHEALTLAKSKHSLLGVQVIQQVHNTPFIQDNISSG